MTNEPTITEEVKNVETFDLSAFISGKINYPTRTAKVVLDRETVLVAHELAEEIDDVKEQKREAQLTDLAPSPEFDEKLEELTAKLKKVLTDADSAALAFVLRGVAPKVWKVADKALRMKFSDQKGKTPEEKIEIDIAFQEAINTELVYNCTVKIIAPGGVETKPSKEEIKLLSEQLDNNEWSKVVALANQLTFETTNLDDAIGSDSDFLSKS